MKPIKHIAIAGNIGAGKTTLCRLLGQHYEWDVHYEDTDKNPYLVDFYDDMKHWSFHLQIYFLTSRFTQVREIREGETPVIQDRTIYEDAHIFAPNLHEMGLMTQKDYTNYRKLFDLMTSHVQAPDLLIYLKANISTLVSHINTRGRDYEGNMSLDYLKRLNEKYEKWISDYNDGPLLIINADDVDFRNNKEDLGKVVDKIDAEIHGLFNT